VSRFEQKLRQRLATDLAFAAGFWEQDAELRRNGVVVTTAPSRTAIIQTTLRVVRHDPAQSTTFRVVGRGSRLFELTLSPPRSLLLR